MANDYGRMLVCGYPCGWEAETIGCLLHHLQPLPTVVFVPNAAAVSSCRLLCIPEIHCRIWRVDSIHLCFIVYPKIVVSLVKIKLNEQGTVNAQNIFNTTTEESNINLLASCILYIGQAYLYSPENAFYIFNQQIYFII